MSLKAPTLAASLQRGPDPASPIPREMRAARQWLVWRTGPSKNGKPTKVPFQVNGRKAASNKSATWSTYEQVSAVRDRFDGIGLVFTADDAWVGVDLDDCVNAGVLKPWARDIVSWFSGTYIEISPSGRGLHIICCGTLPGGKGVKFELGDGHVELYSQGRYFTVTGQAFEGAPSTTAPHQPALDRTLALNPQKKTNGPVLVKTKTAGEVFKKGTRHVALSSEAGRLRNRGFDVDDMYLHLQNYNLTYCDPPKPPEEVRNLVEWVAKQNRNFETNDQGAALCFAELCGATTGWCQDERSWYLFDGKRWQRDNTMAIGQRYDDLISEIALRASRATGSYRDELLKHAGGLKYNRNRKAIIEWAKSYMPLTPDQFDRDDFLLNCLNGTVNLHTGKLQPHRAEDYITMMAPTEYNLEAQCPRFEKFLNEIFKGDKDLIDFVLRALGYSLCGAVTEQCVFLPGGNGANGKSTLLEIVRDMLGDYAWTMDSATLMVRKFDSGPKDMVAGMKGKRLVIAQESDQSSRLAEGLIKWLTGGDLVVARRLYENASEFRPTWKIWFCLNHRPTVRGTDHAIWRRIKMIPFPEKFPINRHLLENLLLERAGILQLLVRHHLLWWSKGLGGCDAVDKASSDYRAENDQVGRFIDDRVTVDKGLFEGARELYTEYVKWCSDFGEGNKEEIMSQRAFGMRMTERGFERENKRGDNGTTRVVYKGLMGKI